MNVITELAMTIKIAVSLPVKLLRLGKDDEEDEEFIINDSQFLSNVDEAASILILLSRHTTQRFPLMIMIVLVHSFIRRKIKNREEIGP